jgi:hypothetical protein
MEASAHLAAQRPGDPRPKGVARARDPGLPFGRTPGTLNALTDVPGVEVDTVTLVSGVGPLRPGGGPARTGVTAILPRRRDRSQDPRAAAGSLADGETVTISCSRTGTSHTGRWGTSAWWHRLGDGTWISDACVWTGVDGPVNGTC